MKRVRVGLNGFGRIGRAYTRIAFSDKNKSLQICAINTSKSSPEMLAYLLKYDSVYRQFDQSVVAKNTTLEVGDEKIVCFNERDPVEIPWSEHSVDVVVDCTGIFTTREDLTSHLSGSVKKVILTAPSKDESIPHIVMGVNDSVFDFKNNDIISNASCTTNCVAPMLKVLDDGLGVESALLTTVHAYTNNQSILDTAQKKMTRSRAAGLSLIPTTTGAAIASSKVTRIPSDMMDAMAIRAPTPVGSLSDLTCIVTTKTTPEAVNALFLRASKGSLKGILAYETVPLVSSDYIGSPYSCIFDANYTKVVNKTFLKVFGWYDNEWGYSNRLNDLTKKLATAI